MTANVNDSSTNVLSIDIGIKSFSCVAGTFSTRDNLVCKCAPVVVDNRTKPIVRSIEITDVFNVNLGEKQGIKSLDALIAVWDNFSIFQFWTPDVILIENQVRKATLNMALSFATYTLAKQKFPSCQAKFVPAKNKFRGYVHFFPNASKPQSLKTYKDRKKEAVRLSNEILQEYFGVSSIQQLSRSEASDDKLRKLDDISDSFLQLFFI